MKFYQTPNCEKCGTEMALEGEHWACREFMAGDDQHDSYPVDRAADSVIQVEGGVMAFSTVTERQTWENQN